MTNSIRKGKNGEREVVNLLGNAGIYAKRISMQETGGIDKGDILIMDRYVGQVKIGSHVPKMFYELFKNGEHIGFVRQDGKKWIVCMGLDLFIQLHGQTIMAG